jgi:hypothetical protein
MDNGYTLNRGGALPFAAALAQGVESGIQSYQATQYKRQEMDLKRQQMDSEAQLRRMQMQKLQQDMAPVMFDASKLELMNNAVNAGMNVPDSLIKDQYKKTFEGIDSPAKLQMANQYLSQKQAALTTQMNPAQFSEMYGSSAKLMMPQPASPVDQASQQYSGQAPQAIQGPVASQPKPSANFSMTPNEAKLYGGLVKDSQNARIGAMTQQGRADSTYASLLNNMNTQASRLAQTQDTNDAREGIAKLQASLKEMEAHLNAQTKKDVARINAKGKVDAVKSRATNSKNPDLSLVDSMIKDNAKALDAMSKPATGFSTELPSELAAKKAAIEQRSQQLLQTRALVASGKKLSDAASAVGLHGLPSAPQAPRGAAPAVIQQAGRPKFMPGPGVSQQISKLPDGQEFEVNGQVFMKQGGQAIPR